MGPVDARKVRSRSAKLIFLRCCEWAMLIEMAVGGDHVRECYAQMMQ